MMKSWKKSIVCLALLPLLLLTSCAGAGDWIFSKLPGNYEVWRMSAHVVRLVDRSSETGGSIVVDSFVSELWWNQDYILVQHKPEDTDPDSAISYYIVVVETGEVLGPLTKDAFDQEVLQQEIPLSEDIWISVWDLKQYADQDDEITATDLLKHSLGSIFGIEEPQPIPVEQLKPVQGLSSND